MTSWFDEEQQKEILEVVKTQVVDGDIYVQLQAYEDLNSLVARAALMSLPMLTEREKIIFRNIVTYYGDFNKLMLEKHAKDIVPNDLTELE